ncbi:hypothetical protein P22_0513 [Propionispora sp. 2/2-37]|uniref:DUF2922 domain-containing protein n=1 Tax=Propionispora sp. 2/2-37 TaxID=1677858 RepID=UPI0006BB7801|nr:DUF2922 domain-containing protein [Propionispora sp. 2/2-37]CUH94447.1 hypothetical protein P22_0513 [Propionispora sp. 2/2-37]
MAATLEMVFRNEAGKTSTISLADPKDGLTQAQVQAVMQDIITRNIFHTSNGNLVEFADARVRTSETVSLS